MTGQIAVTPVIAPGVAGTAVVTVTAWLEAELVPHELDAVTETVPLAAEPFVDTVMLLVPDPLVMLQPEGNDQL